ncbi:MAG: methyltransferase domain-containing protein [Patescibacteria group bacterium]
MIHQKVPGGNGLLNPQQILKENLNIPSGSYVGDFGCGGAGYFVMQTARIVGENGLVYAVDIQKTVLSNIESQAKELKLDNIKIIWSNLEKYGACRVNNESLDYGLIINVLFQNKDKPAVLKEVARMVKKDGKVLVVDWKEGRFPLGPEPNNKIAPKELMDMSQEIGLVFDKQFEAGQYHYGMIFIKQ